MYPVQIEIKSFADTYNAAYLQSLTPEVFYQLWATSGMFGIPMTGKPLDAAGALRVANILAAQGHKVTQADMCRQGPYDWMKDLAANEYKVFSFVGEPNPDWATTRPGDSEPGVPSYDPTGHTGVVSFALLPPYVGPVPVQTLYVGARANSDSDKYNVLNGAEKVFAVGDDYVENGIQYVFLGAIGNNPPVYYWQYIGRA